MKIFSRLITVLLPLFLVAGSWLPAVAAVDRRTPVVVALETASPAVVNIRTERIVERRRSPFFGFGGNLFDEFFRQFAAPPVYRTQSLGSGTIIDPQGLVLTNAHVIAKASKIFVALPGRTSELEATLVGYDERLDLAVLRLPESASGSYPHLRLGKSDDLLVGETVIAIGNPLGLGSSITTGVVSGPLRALSLSEDFMALFIQTDALINPGNSGGPLININGELIGINTAIARQAQGIGFAIPANVASRVLDELVRFGKIRTSFLGVIPGATGEQFAASRGFGGVLVTEIWPGSPAERSGLQLADVILELDGIPVESPNELINFLRSYPPGAKLEVRYLRGLESRVLQLVLNDFPDEVASEYAARTFGFRLSEVEGGLQVAKVLDGSSAEKVGMRRGDFLVEAAGIRISQLTEFVEVVKEHFGQLPMNFLVVRRNQGYYIDLP